MQHRPSLSIPASPARLPLGGGVQAPALPGDSARKMACGWYDSSLDLAQGLEIVEQDDDALYQLWQLSRH